jgi:hypothetical protein
MCQQQAYYAGIVLTANAASIRRETMPQSSDTSENNPNGSAQQRGFITSATHRIASLVTLKRVGVSVAGTFAFVGAAAALNATGTVGSNAATKATPTTPTQQSASTSDQSASQPNTSPADIDQDASGGATTHTSFSATTTNGQTNVNLTVNGKNIPLPANGSTQQTVTNTDGSQTTVNTSTNVSSNSTATNSSSSSFSVNVNNSSSSEVHNTP